MAKRLICVIISVLMIISLLPTGAFATEDTGEAVLAVSENENVEETEEANEEVNEEETEEVTVSEAQPEQLLSRCLFRIFQSPDEGDNPS